MNDNYKHWTTELLTLFGMWLWEEEEYGHALLCIHGPQWGYKIGQQLKLSWEDVFNDDWGEFKHELELEDNSEIVRPITGKALEYLEKAFKMLKERNEGDSIYLNYRTGKPLTTSTLNRELKKHSDQFLYELTEKLGYEIKLKPLKSNAFQIAWVLKMLDRYRYSKKCMIEMSKFMGHRTLKDTIELIEIEPMEKIIYDFLGSEMCRTTSDILQDKEQLSIYVNDAINDSYTEFKKSITHL
ncbi:hypothetical protein [Lutimonas vermicola]|uniref:Tyr recombinase domain-containing protein n=1 Tax=Lutimonas vermicola TaxID=414288 RepID=A0ABU9L5D6_9FLAO